MEFGFYGINYKNASLDIRDQTSFTDSMKAELFENASQIGIEQCMVLSTCNRSEIYFFYETDKQLQGMRNLYCEMFPQIVLDDYLITYTKQEAMEYLFRIAAGLESLVLGEDQILGQVKDALDFARTMGFVKKEMNRVVLNAITCAKRIKTQFKISERPLSVSYVGIQKLEENGGISGKTVLIIGSGKTAALAITYIYDHGAARVLVCNRTRAHVHTLLEEFPDLEIIAYEKRYQAMQSCDMVVSATASPHTIIKKEKLQVKKPIVFLDLAAPRDVDMQIDGYCGMKVINIDTLQEIVKKNQLERNELAQQCQSMITEDLQETMEWLLSSRMDATIETLQQRCEEIVGDSFDYLNRKIELSTHEQKILRKVLNASVHRILREPIQELKLLDTQEKQDEYRKMVHQLFRIEGQEE